MVCRKSLARAGAGGTISASQSGAPDLLALILAIADGQPRKSRDYRSKAVRVSGCTMGLFLVAIFGIIKAVQVVLMRWQKGKGFGGLSHRNVCLIKVHQ